MLSTSSDLDLKVLPPDYRAYIAKFMHPIELTLASESITEDILQECIALKWHAGIEFILQTGLPLTVREIFQILKIAPDLLLSYTYWHRIMQYDGVNIHDFILIISTAGYELEYIDWHELCSVGKFQISVMRGASRSGNIALMRKIFSQHIENTEVLLDTFPAIKNNQLAAVNLLLVRGADPGVAWRRAVCIGRTDIMRILPPITDFQYIIPLICQGLENNQLDAVMLLNTLYLTDRILLDTCGAAIHYGHISVVIRIWNQHADLRDAIRELVRECDLQYMLF